MQILEVQQAGQVPSQQAPHKPSVPVNATSTNQLIGSTVVISTHGALHIHQ
jgi:hypothetical protein